MLETFPQEELKATRSNLDDYVPDYIAHTLNDPERWYPDMPMPEGFNRDAARRYQSLIDKLIGTAANQPIIKLVWGPEVLEWWPCQIGMEEKGYTYPSWVALWDSQGQLVAAPRWCLMQRSEPAQYMPGWNAGRWVRLDDALFDAKGPPPRNGHYTRLYRHVVHKDSCCLRADNEENCWGYYVEPNEELLQWICMQYQESLADPEVQPHTILNDLPYTNREREDKAHLESQRILTPEGTPVVMPTIVPGYFKNGSGLYVPNN